jgi:hypothetical protein
MGAPSPSCSVELMPESHLGDALATDADVVPTGTDAACVGAELAVAAGRELQHCPTATVVHASVNIVPTTACVGLGVNALRVGMEAAADGSLQLDLSADGSFKLAELNHDGPPAASRAMAATTTDVESGPEVSCASDGGGSDGDEVMSDAVTVILDCSNSVAVAGDGIAAAAVLEDVPVPRQWRDAVAAAVADAVEDVDGCVPPSGLGVTWSWLMEE